MRLQLFSKETPLHLFYFPVLFVVNHFFIITTPRTDLINSPWAWILNFAGAIGVCVIVPFAISKLLQRRFNTIKSGVITTIFFLPFFFLQDLLLSGEQVLFLGLRARWLLPFIAVLLTGICYWIAKAKRSFFSFNQFLNVVSFSLVVYTAIVLIFSFKERFPKVLNYTPDVYAIDSKERPDIYLLVLDSYTSNKSLRTYFQFDNNKFTEKLKGLDFEVTDQAISSHTRTGYSLAAILNLAKIERLDDYDRIDRSLNKNSVVESLKKESYEIHNYSIFKVGDQAPYYFLGPTGRLKFIEGIFQSSILNIIVYDVGLKLKLYDINRSILQKMHDEGIKDHVKPRFFYGHVLAPHPPFVMDSTGQPINILHQSRSVTNAAAYIAQMKGLNNLVFNTIKEIIQTSPDAIVIITGDHGYRYLDEPYRDEESHTVFLAYHGPNKEKIHSLARSNMIFQLIFKDASIPKQDQ